MIIWRRTEQGLDGAAFVRTRASRARKRPFGWTGIRTRTPGWFRRSRRTKKSVNDAAWGSVVGSSGDKPVALIDATSTVSPYVRTDNILCQSKLAAFGYAGFGPVTLIGDRNLIDRLRRHAGARVMWFRDEKGVDFAVPKRTEERTTDREGVSLQPQPSDFPQKSPNHPLLPSPVH